MLRERTQEEVERYNRLFAWLDYAKRHGYDKSGKLPDGEALLSELKIAWEVYGIPEAREANLRFTERQLNIDELPPTAPVNPWIRSWFSFYAVARMRRKHFDQFKYFSNRKYYIPFAMYLHIPIRDVRHEEYTYEDMKWVWWKLPNE